MVDGVIYLFGEGEVLIFFFLLGEGLGVRVWLRWLYLGCLYFYFYFFCGGRGSL